MGIMVKAVIFDADGMVIRAERFSQQLERDYGISRDKTKYFFENEFQRCLLGKSDLKKILSKYLSGWEWQGRVEEFMDYWFKSGDRVDEQLVEYIRQLKSRGVRCYLATNQEKYRTEYFRLKMGFADLFDGIFSSAEIGYKKPSQEFFAGVLKRMGSVKKEEVIFWDDDSDNVMGAGKFGFKSQLYKGFDGFKQKMSEYLTIDTI